MNCSEILHFTDIQNCVIFLDLIQMNVREVIWMEISTLSVGILN